jgi:hypothetical protein
MKILSWLLGVDGLILTDVLKAVAGEDTEPEPGLPPPDGVFIGPPPPPVAETNGPNDDVPPEDAPPAFNPPVAHPPPPPMTVTLTCVHDAGFVHVPGDVNSSVFTWPPADAAVVCTVLSWNVIPVAPSFIAISVSYWFIVYLCYPTNSTITTPLTPPALNLVVGENGWATLPPPAPAEAGLL